MPDSPRSILVVDDEQLVCRFTARILQGAGYRVLTAADGFEALRLLARLAKVDLLLTDVRMPGMSGVQLAERVRDQSSARHLLFISGFVSEEFTESLPGAFLRKPFTDAALLSQVQQLLETPA